ncbi:phage tail protein [Sphingomonas parapaucimobilis]|uniref:Tip attachment protein J domain-containing protein n=1 Tax=Sphingomonas parapaucimobilis NBRC 15100 TaxID=1219049 RepID=A0A0A1W5W0_9SPHN|nr:phage tail protein [Sphingomonas parapaucimobilis]GAM00572.1 hypothetical protein SP5_034_01470 [Sphingomonas parapaucimobilis NBRC 15100]
MAKALKIGAMVLGGAALLATGVGAIAMGGLAGSLAIAGVSVQTLFLASAGLSIASSLLQKTDVPASQTQRLSATIDPRAFRTTVLGQTAMATDIRYEEWHGAKQDYCSWIVALASHAIHAVDEIWLNDELAWSTVRGVTSKFAGYFSVPRIVTEGWAGVGYSFASGQWNAAHRLTGCAWCHLQFKITGNSKGTDSPFSGGPPSRITIIGRGAMLYDPRRDSTVPGGSGPMRADDQSTWRYVTDDGAVIGENLPLQILRVLLGWRITNPVTGAKKLAVGMGLPIKRIGRPSFIVAANHADEQVPRVAGGGTEPRYQGAGVLSEGSSGKEMLDTLCGGCCGRIMDAGGKLDLILAHNDLAAAATDDGLMDDDVIGSFTWNPDPALDATPNVVRGRYVDATPAGLYQMMDFPEVEVPSPDGIDRPLSLDLPIVESPRQAQQIASQTLQRRQRARTFTALFDIRAWRWPVGAVVPFTFSALAFDRKLFRVTEQEYAEGGACQMTLTVEDAAIYAPIADRAAVPGGAYYGFNPALDPIAQAIAAAASSEQLNQATRTIDQQAQLIQQQQNALSQVTARVKALEDASQEP